MRAQFGVLFVAGLISHVTVDAQSNGPSARSGVDFSGVYRAAFVGMPAFVTEPEEYPFTAAAERTFNAYDPLVASANQVDDCAAVSMPSILWSTDPMQIVQEDERVVIRFEEDDFTRSIPLGGTPPAEDQPHSQLGYSLGRWVGDVLTIETTHMLDGFIHRGYPISRDARITERYWREPGENDLQMELLVDDPANYTETFTLGWMWVWSPDEQIRPWECVSLGPRGSEAPDIDELVRMLEEL